jgi:hypothetical protein
LREKSSAARRIGNQSIPPLKVYSNNNLRVANKAGQLGLTIGQYLRVDPMPDPIELAWKYVRGEPLVSPQMVPLLLEHMGKLHEWYLELTKRTYRNYLMMAVQKKHYFREDSIAIELEDLFQFFNLMPSKNLS